MSIEKSINFKHRMVCSTNLFGAVSRAEAFEAIASLGFQFIDLYASPPIADHVNIHEARADDIRRDLDYFGLQAVSISLYLTTLEEKLRGVALAAELGAEYVIVEPAPASDWYHVMTGLEVERSRLWGDPGASLSSYTNSLNRILGYAESCGVDLCVEVPHVATLAERIDQAAELSRLDFGPSLRYILAPHHTVLSGEKLETAIKKLEDRLLGMYLWNVRRGYRPGQDGRFFGNGAEQLGNDSELDLTLPTRLLMSRFKSQDIIVCAHGTEDNKDVNAVKEMIKGAIAHAPDELLEANGFSIQFK